MPAAHRSEGPWVQDTGGWEPSLGQQAGFAVALSGCVPAFPAAAVTTAATVGLPKPPHCRENTTDPLCQRAR